MVLFLGAKEALADDINPYQARLPRVLFKIYDTMILPTHQLVAETSFLRFLQCLRMAIMVPRNTSPHGHATTTT